MKNMDFNEIIDLSSINKLDPEKGRILISEPFMPDSTFKRSVIFLCEHNEEGSFGYVLNHQLNIPINELIDDVTNPDFKVNFGGPVKPNNLYFLHSLGEKIENSVEVIDGLYTGGDFDQLKDLINTGIVTPDQVKFYLGYSGWTAGQLTEEMKLNSWIVGNIPAKDVFTDKATNWQYVLRKMGGKFKMISNFPADPTLN